MSRCRIAVFASGTGSNFDALMRYARAHDVAYDVVALVCDQPQATVIEKAERWGVPVGVFQPRTYASRPLYERAIVEQLQALAVERIVLAGYMRLVTSVLLEAYPEHIVNVHPSLLPSFPGLEAIAQAYAHGVKQTGVTVHLVDAGMDTGPILAQVAVSIGADDTLATLTERIHREEHRLYPMTVDAWVRQQYVREGRVMRERPTSQPSLDFDDQRSEHS